MDNFCLENRIFYCLKKSKFSKIFLQNSIFFVKLHEKIEIFWKFACRNRNFVDPDPRPPDFKPDFFVNLRKKFFAVRAAADFFRPAAPRRRPKLTGAPPPTQ